MNKREFEKYVLRNLENIQSIHCNIVEGYDIDNNNCCWLDVYISGDTYTTIFCSDDYSLDSKEIVTLQKRWLRKLDSWINPNWGIEVKSERTTL